MTMVNPILIVHNNYQQPGGERTAVRSQIELLQSHKHELIIYWRDSAVIATYDWFEKILFFPQTIYHSTVYHEVYALVQHTRPAVAHVHNVFPLISPAVYLALRDARVPIVQTLHNFRLLCPNGLFYTHGKICERCAQGNMLHAVRWRCYRESYILSALYAAALSVHHRYGTFAAIDRFIALSNFGAHKVVATGLTTSDRVRVLANFLTLPPLPLVSVDRDRPYLIVMGRASPEKGFALAIHAMSQFPDLDLFVVGDGPQLAELRLQARLLQNVYFLGSVQGDERWRLLSGAIATLVPSCWYETFGLIALESLAVGTPVIAARIGALPDFVQHKRTGLLFTPNDVTDLVLQIRWLLDNPIERTLIGRAGAELVRTRYSATAHYEQLIKIYTELAQEMKT